MANIYWYNGSSKMVKWMTQDRNGNWSGNALDPGRDYVVSDNNIINSGFLCSGFTGIVQAPVPLPPGWSGVHLAYDNPSTAAQMKEVENKLAEK